MVVRRRSTSLKQRFSASSIAVALVKVESQRSGKKKIVAKFFPAFLREKRLGRRSQCWFATKTHARKITQRSPRRFGHRMPISPTRPNTGFEIGRVGAALLLARQSGVWQRVQLREEFCAQSFPRSTSSPTLRKSTRLQRRSTWGRWKYRTSIRILFAARTKRRQRK